MTVFCLKNRLWCLNQEQKQFVGNCCCCCYCSRWKNWNWDWMNVSVFWIEVKTSLVVAVV